MEGTWRMLESNQSTFTETTVRVSSTKLCITLPRYTATNRDLGFGWDREEDHSGCALSQWGPSGGWSSEHQPSHRCLSSTPEEPGLRCSTYQGNVITLKATSYSSAQVHNTHFFFNGKSGTLAKHSWPSQTDTGLFTSLDITHTCNLQGVIIHTPQQTCK